MKSCLRGLAACCLLLGAVACEKAPDFRAVIAERGKPVQRFDTFLAAASDGKRLVSAAGGAVIVTSADGGRTWSREPLATPSSIVGMSACPDGSFAALDFYRKVWIGDAQGRHWTARRIGADFNPLAISCDAQNRLWVVGSFSMVMTSTDRGASWLVQPPGKDAILTAVQFLDARHGFIGGEFGTLLVTTDGGATWTRQPGLPDDFYPYAMYFADLQDGWVSGLGGTILHTQDGGRTWTQQTNGTGASMYALLRVDGRMVGVGAGGQVLELDGERWSPVGAAHRTAYLAAGAALASDAVLVAGASGALDVVPLGSSGEVHDGGPGAAATGARP